MQHGKKNALLLVGERNNLDSSFLLQFATYWAEAGVRVSYISPVPLSQLPHPIHGAAFPSSSGLSQIQFLYLPHWHDLLQHLFSLHCHALVPRAVILQGLDHYCSSSKSNGEDKNGTNSSIKTDTNDEYIVASLCAALFDALSVCSSRNGNKEIFCICSYERSCRDTDFHSITSFISPLNAFFDNIWWVKVISDKCAEEKSSIICKTTCKCEFVKIKKILNHCNELENESSLEFLCKNSAIFLQTVLEITRM